MEELKGNESTTFFYRTKNHSTLSGAFECNYFDGGGGVGSKTSQSSKVQMPGESLRERECLGFEVTDALPAAQKNSSNQDHRPSLYWSYFNLKSNWLREEGFLVMITVHCKLNQMNAFIHITFNPPLKIGV